MHELMSAGPPLDSDQYVLDNEAVRGLIAVAREAIASADSPEAACEAIRPHFARLLADDAWLPAAYQQDAPQSGMGGGIGQWLLFRSALGSLVPLRIARPRHSLRAGWP